MRLRHFVATVSAALMGWLAVSYFHQVPVKRVVTVATAPVAEETPVVEEAADENGELTVSVSR